MKEASGKHPKYQEIIGQIKAKISSGELKQGDYAPSINDLTAPDISRSTVKRAYDVLVDRGVLIAEKGKGYRVAHPLISEFPASTEWCIFLSYAHADDVRSDGGITTLCRKIQAEYEMQTGHQVSIFQDIKDIEWGADWRRAIDSSLGSTLFFMPILTPTYLRSPNCLAELRIAIGNFKAYGYESGICPIEFVDCTNALSQFSDDDLAGLLGDIQRDRKWIELQYEDPCSSAYRKGVRDIVHRLMQKEEQMGDVLAKRAHIDGDSQARNQTGSISSDVEEDVEDESPLEVIASVDDSIKQLTASTIAIGEDINDIGNVFNEAHLPDKPTPKQAVEIANQIAANLERPSNSISKHSKEFVEYMSEADRAIDAIIELFEISSELGQSSAYKASMDEMREAASGLSAITNTSFDQIEGMRYMLRSFSKISRSLRSPCNKIDIALNDVVSSKQVIETWEVKLTDALMQ